MSGVDTERTGLSNRILSWLITTPPVPGSLQTAALQQHSPRAERQETGQKNKNCTEVGDLHSILSLMSSWADT